MGTVASIRARVGLPDARFRTAIAAGRPADWLPHLDKAAGHAGYVGLVAERPAPCLPAFHSQVLQRTAVWCSASPA